MMDNQEEIQQLRAAVAALTDERNKLRRELELVDALISAAATDAKAEVKRKLMRLTLDPLQAACGFAARLRDNPGEHNPRLLIVPLNNVIQVLKQQGFVADAEISEIKE